MQNPFTKDDAVLTKVKGKPVEATVVQTWKGEVQVKTATGDLLWRSMYTVWRAGEEPLKREVEAAPNAATSASDPAAASITSVASTPAPDAATGEPGASATRSKKRGVSGASKSQRRKRR